MTSTETLKKIFRSPSRFLGWRRELLLLFVPSILALLTYQLRPWAVQPRCAETPEHCNASTLNDWDQVAVHQNDHQANAWSFVTQNSSGYLAAGVPAIWAGLRVLLRSATPMGAFTSYGIDLLILLQSTAWNLWINETTRMIVQRPRPVVLRDPKTLGANPAHYTSFYSGHTSFAALASTSLTLALAGQGTPKTLLVATSLVGIGLITSTAYLRVAAGKHYPTDTLMGAFAGITIACALFWFHRRGRSKA